MIWTGTLSCLNTLMEDKRPVTGTGGDGTGRKTQTLICTCGRSVNAERGMCNVLHQIAGGGTSSLFHLYEIDTLSSLVHNDVR